MQINNYYFRAKKWNFLTYIYVHNPIWAPVTKYFDKNLNNFIYKFMHIVPYLKLYILQDAYRITFLNDEINKI